MGSPEAAIASTSAPYFDQRAATYDAAHDRPGPAREALRSRMVATLELLGDEPGEVLDAGMGPGRLCEALCARGWRVSGVDPAPGRVARARARLPDAVDRLHEGRLEALPFPDASFDAVVSTGAIEYAADRAAAVSELARVLRPGGRAIVTAPNQWALYAFWCTLIAYPGTRVAHRALGRPGHGMPRGPRLWPSSLTRMLLQAGLVPEARRYTSPLIVPPPLDRAAPRLAARLAAAIDPPPAGLRVVTATQVVMSSRRVGQPTRSRYSRTMAA